MKASVILQAAKEFLLPAYGVNRTGIKLQGSIVFIVLFKNGQHI